MSDTQTAELQPAAAKNEPAKNEPAKSELVRTDQRLQPTNGNDLHHLEVVRPAVDIQDFEDRYVMLLDVPGATTDSLELALDKGMLTIRAQTRPEEHRGMRLAHTEYIARRFYRQFQLSERVDKNRIDASLKNGVLRIELHKLPVPAPRKIEVQTTP